MGRKTKSLPGWPINGVRLTLFLIWTFFFAAVVLIYFFTGRFNSAVDETQAIDAGWRASYIVTPVLMAFMTFWFAPSKLKGGPSDAHIRIETSPLVAALVITLLMQGLYLVFLILFIVTKDYNFPKENSQSFAGLADRGLLFLSLACTFGVLPVGYVLGKEVHLPEQTVPVQKNPGQ